MKVKFFNLEFKNVGKEKKDDDEFNEDEFVKKLLKDQNIKSANVVDVDNMELLDQIDEEIIMEGDDKVDDEEEAAAEEGEKKKEFKKKRKETDKSTPDHKISLRTILCSATIESFKPKFEIRNNNQKGKKNQNITQFQMLKMNLL